jgi:hypothetical protein
MLDMTLHEILSSLYIVEPDALKIWLGLQKAYPPGAFFNVMEDMIGGAGVSGDSLKKLQQEVNDISINCHREVAKASERLYLQIRQKDLLLDKKVQEINTLRDRNVHALKLFSEDLRVFYEAKLREQ